MFLRILACAMLIALASPSYAQTAVIPYWKLTPNSSSSIPVTTSTPLPIGVYGGTSATAGDVLTSNGPGSLATFQPAGGGEGGTVTDFVFTNGSGVTGTVANPTTTPTLSVAPTAGGTFASSLNNLGFFAATTSAQLSGVISDETGSGSLVFGASPSMSSVALSGSNSITSTSATCLTVGENGATNPVVTVNCSTANQSTGLAIAGAATAGTTTITATDASANASLSISSKGNGPISLNAGASNVYQASTTTQTFTVQAMNGGSTAHWTFGNNAGDANLTAGAEAVNFKITGFSPSHATGTLALQRDVLLQGSTHNFVAASTLTNDATLGLTLGNGGTNSTVTNLNGLYIPTQVLTGTVTNSYGINIAAASGATNNYAALFNGLIISAGSAPTCGSGCASITANSTNTRGSTTGGTLVSSIVVNWSATLPSAPFCTISQSGITQMAGMSTSTTALTITFPTTLSGDVISWICMQ